MNDDPLTLDPHVLDRLRALDPDGTRGFLRRAFDLWHSVSATELASMEHALATKERSVLAASAHRLRGSTSMLGGLALAAVLGELERRALDATDDLLKDLVARVRTAHVRLAREFDESRGSAA